MLCDLCAVPNVAISDLVEEQQEFFEDNADVDDNGMVYVCRLCMHKTGLSDPVICDTKGCNAVLKSEEECNKIDTYMFCGDCYLKMGQLAHLNGLKDS